MRITEKVLQNLVNLINDEIYKDNHPYNKENYSIDNAPCYGGWSLIIIERRPLGLGEENYSRTIVNRLPPKEFKRVLEGMLIGMGAYHSI